MTEPSGLEANADEEQLLQINSIEANKIHTFLKEKNKHLINLTNDCSA